MPATAKVTRGKVAAPTIQIAERAESGPRCVGEAARPAKMTLEVGKSSLMRLPEAVVHRSVGDTTVVQAMLVAPDTLYLLGIDVGTTNMIIQGRSGACSVIDLNVMLDPAGLQAALATAMPDETNIKVSTASEALVLTGTVSDVAALQRAYELALVFVHQPAHPLMKKGDDSGTAVSRASNEKVKYPPEARVINMLSVTAPQQVMLEVKVAEVSKSLLERLEGAVMLRASSGSWATTLLSNFLSGPAAFFDARKTNGNRVSVDADKQDGLVRILAEPNVMAISGQEGSFLAGGKIFIPVAQDNNKVTLEEKEFGVGLRFTPTVLAGGRINLRVTPEVSEISREGIGISAAGFTGTAVLPLITTRRASTTVQLFDGQSFAIGGLIKDNFVTSLKGLPVMGEIPVLGALFRSTDYQQDRTELVFVVTARLVKPLPSNFSLPTDSVTPPNRGELMLGGRLEGTPSPASGGKTASASGQSASTSPAASGGSGFELK
jgi:pilus assembly protein CpaC